MLAVLLTAFFFKFRKMPAKAEPNLRRHDVGTTVRARWPKSTFYFEGEIIDYNDVEYLIRFNDTDHSELAIKYKDVMLPERVSRSRSRGRTPTRSQNKKSPGRKSPARKSPARKSPGRSLTVESSPKKSSRGRPRNSLNVSANNKVETETVIEKKVEKKTEVEDSSIVRSRPTRQSARIASIEKPKVDGLPSNNIKVDVQAITKAVESQNSIKNIIYRGGSALIATVVSTSVIALFVASTFILNQMCTKNKCSIRDWPDIPRKLQYYYDQKALMVTGAYFASLLLLAVIPIGKVVKARSGANVRCNGYISLIACCGSIPILQLLKYDVVSLYLLYRQFIVIFAAIGILLAVVVYIKSFYASKENLNPRGNSGYWVPDFIEGREIQPHFWNLDVKFFLFRASMLMLLMINIIIALKSVQSSAGSYSPTVLFSCSLQVLFIIDLFWFEECYLTTFDYKNEGTGLKVCLGYMNLPFIMAIWPRYVFNHRSEIPWYCLVGIGMIYLFGYIIYRGSTSQKHTFRTNPNGPAVAHLDSVPTSASSRLLVCSWWGFVRHPNYLGDMICQICMPLVCGFSHAIPWAVFGISFSYQLLRMYDVENYCRAKYGLGWSNYTSRVKHLLIPKVF